MSAAFRLGDCIVRPQRHLIERGDETVHVKPRSMSVLECLAAAQGEPVSRNELFDTVWRGAEVTDDTLTKCIVELRKAFGDTARESRVIETIPKLGFRLVLPVETLEKDAATPTPSAPKRWQRRLRTVGLLALGMMAVLATLLSIDRSRLWLTELGVTGFMKTAAYLAPYSLEQRPGIAVLPFVNMSGDPENEYFSEGMSVEIINALGRTNRLPVISRNSSFQFKGRNEDSKEVGRLLGVTHVLEGSVRKAGHDIRLTAQLIDTATGTQIWSGAYQSELRDIFQLQNKIASDIVDKVLGALGKSPQATASGLPTTGLSPARHTANLEAYDLYLKGMEMLRSTDPIPIEQSVSYFDRAIALDEEYADAWAAKGLALYSLGRVGFGHALVIPASVYPNAIAALRRALEIEPGHAAATGWLGATLIVNDYKWAEGLRLMEESLASSPNDADLLAVYAMYLGWMHIAGSEEALYRAFRLDPVGLVPLLIRAGRLADSGRLVDAAALLEIGFLANRDGYMPNYYSAVYYLRLGRLDAAQERLRKARQFAHPVDLSLDALEWVIDSLRTGRPLPPLEYTLHRMQKERLSNFVRFMVYAHERVPGKLPGLNIDAKVMVAIFDLALRQRQPELRPLLFGPRPPLMPEAEWRRIKEMAGVTQFQQSLRKAGRLQNAGAPSEAGSRPLD